MAKKVFQFNRASSFRYGAGKDSPGLARKYVRQKDRRLQTRQQPQLRQSANHRDRSKHPRLSNQQRELRSRPPKTASAPAIPPAYRQTSAATNIHRELNSSALPAFQWQ